MRKKYVLVWVVAIIVFLFAQVDIACAMYSHTTGNSIHAALLSADNTNLNEGDNSDLQTTGYKAHTVYVNGDNSSWTFGNDSLLVTTHNFAHGVTISGDHSSVVFSDGTEIYTKGLMSYGICLDGDAADSVTFGNHTTIMNDDASSIGASINGVNSSITFGDDTTITANNYATAVMVSNTYSFVGSSEMRFGDRAEISSDGLAIGVTDGTLTIGDDAKINSYDFRALEVQNSSGNRTEVKIGDRATIIAAGPWGAGIYYYAGTTGALITLGDEATIVAEGANSRAIEIAGENGQVKLGKSADITTNGYGADAVWAGNHSRIEFDDGAKITTTGGQTRMLYTESTTDSASIIFGDNSILTAKGANTHVAYAAGANSIIALGSGTEIKTTNGGYGAWSSGAGAKITFRDNTTITTNSGYGVVATGNNASIEFGDGTSITTSGAGAHGAMITTSGGNTGSSSIKFGGGTSISTDGSKAYGAYILKANSSMSFGGGTSITTTNNGAHGVAVIGTGSTMVFDGDVSIVTGGDNTSSAIVSGGSTSIEFKGDTAITTSGNGSYALYADQGAIASTQGGKYTISGDMAANVGTIDLDMTSGSLFTGKTNGYSGITLNMADSRWNVTGESYLGYLSLDATIVDYSSSALGTIIYIGTLDGPGGTFVMKTDIVNETADVLVAYEMNGSQHNISVRNDGSAETTGNEVVDLAHTDWGLIGSFQLTNAVELGAWKYDLRKVSEDGCLHMSNYGSCHLWQLYATGQVSTTTGGAVNTVYPLYLLSYVDTQTLMQRLGDLRASPAQNGFWFKAHGGSFEFKANGVAQPFDMDYWGVQLGYDRKLETSWNGDLHAGIMFGYNDGDLDYTSGGSGSVDSKTLGIYGTYVQPNGLFVDLVLKYQWMDSDFDVLDSAGTRVTGNGASSGGFGASLELGKRISFTKKQQKSGWYVEPQVQMSLQRLGGGYFTASNGLRIGADNYTSLLGRIGILAGYETEKSNFYAKVSRVKEFDGDVTILANGQPIDITFDSSWWVYGLGYTSRLDDRNSIYIDLERASGGLFTQKWAIKAGWRMVL